MGVENVGGGGEWRNNNMLQEKIKLHFERKKMIKHLNRRYVSPFSWQ